MLFLAMIYKDTLERAEELEKTNRVLKQDVLRAKEEKLHLEETLKHPLARLALKIVGFLQRYPREAT